MKTSSTPLILFESNFWKSGHKYYKKKSDTSVSGFFLTWISSSQASTKSCLEDAEGSDVQDENAV